jgi:hypothetical protein
MRRPSRVTLREEHAVASLRRPPDQGLDFISTQREEPVCRCKDREGPAAAIQEPNVGALRNNRSTNKPKRSTWYTRPSASMPRRRPREAKPSRSGLGGSSGPEGQTRGFGSMLAFVPGTLIVVGFVVLGVVLLAYAFYFLVIKKW